MHETYTLEKHPQDGMPYVKEISFDLFHPRRYTTWWSLGVRTFDYALMGHGENIGQPLAPVAGRPGTYRFVNLPKAGWIQVDPRAYATYAETEDVPEPTLTGQRRHMELAWREGQWMKYTRKGWKSAP